MPCGQAPRGGGSRRTARSRRWLTPPPTLRSLRGRAPGWGWRKSGGAAAAGSLAECGSLFPDPTAGDHGRWSCGTAAWHPGCYERLSPGGGHRVYRVGSAYGLPRGRPFLPETFFGIMKGVIGFCLGRAWSWSCVACRCYFLFLLIGQGQLCKLDALRAPVPAGDGHALNNQSSTRVPTTRPRRPCTQSQTRTLATR